MHSNKLHYLTRKEVDTDKWNTILTRATNSRCYAHTQYLDAMASDWDALVLNDYEAVMPLPWRKKYGVRYIYQPAFCQQLGIINDTGVQDQTNLFLSKLTENFRYWDIQLNSMNSTASFNAIPRKNYLLSLKESYKDLSAGYSRNATRNIRMAKESGVQIKENIDPSILFKLHLSRFEGKNRISSTEYNRFQYLIEEYIESGHAMANGAADEHGNIIASSAFILFKDRITFIINGNSEVALNNGATHLLMDHIIHKFSGTQYVLDFEGSDNPQFSRFYDQYGHLSLETYPRIIYNNLRWPWKWFKR